MIPFPSKTAWRRVTSLYPEIPFHRLYLSSGLPASSSIRYPSSNHDYFVKPRNTPVVAINCLLFKPAVTETRDCNMDAPWKHYIAILKDSFGEVQVVSSPSLSGLRDHLYLRMWVNDIEAAISSYYGRKCWMNTTYQHYVLLFQEKSGDVLVVSSSSLADQRMHMYVGILVTTVKNVISSYYRQCPTKHSK